MFQPKPLNIFNQVILDGYILPSKYILGPAIKIVLLLTSAYGSAFQLSWMSFYLFSNCRYTSKILLLEFSFHTTDVINLLFTCLVIVFGFNMDHFREFISTIQLLHIETDSFAVRKIKRNRRIIQALLSVAFTIYMTLYIITAKGLSIHTDNPFVFILRCFHAGLFRFGSLFHLNMICNICFCLKAAFNQINSQIANLNKLSDQSFGHLFHKIRDLRQKYSYAVRSTQSAEQLFRYYITRFYMEYFAFVTMNIVMSFGRKTRFDSSWFLYMLIDAILFILLTYNLVSVNNLSRKGMEDLYELSFKLNTFESCHENDIFIARMALSDVGFTFANLFTINNSFITSLFTLSLTIIITLASFIYQ
ncbi:uncharacterized protein LOC107362047 [Tetranychus urticae]|uniref:Gustatory receptor n=1 Tax=Tetranychus urticae TaxID=32264 RepID=T1JU74_TETUR|nr:uncharacterized protein LOC107362047 [Tetranychus urticae]